MVSELPHEHVVPPGERGKKPQTTGDIEFQFCISEILFLRDNGLISFHQTQFFPMGYRYLMTSSPRDFAKDPLRVRQTAPCYTHELSFRGAPWGRGGFQS